MIDRPNEIIPVPQEGDIPICMYRMIHYGKQMTIEFRDCGHSATEYIDTHGNSFYDKGVFDLYESIIQEYQKTKQINVKCLKCGQVNTQIYSTFETDFEEIAESMYRCSNIMGWNYEQFAKKIK